MRLCLLRTSIVVLLALVLLGCSYASVGHLQRQPWALNSQQELDMRFWRFSFMATSASGSYTVAGRALPLTAHLPAEATWIEDLWLAAYLCDDQGRVLAQDLTVFSGLPLDPEEGVPFQFSLKPDQLNRSASLQITFGYNMTLSRQDADADHEKQESADTQGKEGVFFAHEGALIRI